MGKSIADLVREKYSEPSQCLGEVARVKYRGYDINIMDLMERIKREQKMKLPITKIIKKRADYQKYLENREKKKLNVNLPEIKYPDMKLPSMPTNVTDGLHNIRNSQGNHHAAKDERKSRENMPLKS